MKGMARKGSVSYAAARARRGADRSRGRSSARAPVPRVGSRHAGGAGTVHAVGYLAGGDLPPPPAGELVRLRIGIASTRITYGVKIDGTGNGRFKTRYTFGLGQASVRRHYWFQLQALPQDDYPYSASDSRRAGVIVGG